VYSLTLIVIRSNRRALGLFGSSLRESPAGFREFGSFREFGAFGRPGPSGVRGLRDPGSLRESGAFGSTAAFRNTCFRYSRLPLYPAAADSRISLFPPTANSRLLHNPAILYPQASNHSPIHPQDNCRPAKGCRDGGYPPPPADTVCIPCNVLCSTSYSTLH